MYEAKISLNDANCINPAGLQASTTLENTNLMHDITSISALSLLDKACAGRRTALKNLTASGQDMRIKNVLLFNAKKQRGFEAVDTIIKQLVMHKNIIAAE